MSSRRVNRRGVFVVAGAVSASVAWAANPSFNAGITTGSIQNSAIPEASGIAASRLNTNVLWTHNDSGNPAQVFAMTSAGVQLATYSFSGVIQTDWEDIAVGPGPNAGTQYLYLGDIGDNGASRATVSVYRMAEPTVSDTQAATSGSLGGYSKLTFNYPNGSHDAESMFVDPLTRDIYIVSKRDATKYVYRAAYPQSTSGTTTMELVASLSNSNWITAADISPDGDEIIMRAGATNTGLMYMRPSGGSVADAFATTPISIPLLSESQGEAIGFDPQGWGYYTTSESTAAAPVQPIHYYNRLAPPAAAMYWDNDSVAAGSRATSGAGLGGTGSWDTSSLKWYNQSSDVAWAANNDAIFFGTAGTVTLAAAQSVNSLTFKTNGYIVSGLALTLTGPTVTVDAGVTATINSIVAGAAGLVKEGAGKLVLTSSSNQTSGYTGGTTINAGTLNIASGAVGRSGTGITINNGATLQLTGDFTLAAARSVTIGLGGGVIDTQANSDSIAGVMTGSSLTKIGSGTLTLSNANTYTGTLTVSAGTLRLATGGGVLLKAGALSISPGATLDQTNNKIILTASSVGAVSDLLAAGQLINSTAAGVTALATARADDVARSTFGGTSVAASDVLVMYTWQGDANLSGNVDADDFFQVDSNYGKLPGANRSYFVGDFNYDDTIDGDDYAIIDAGFSGQGLPLGGPSANDVTSVPEPALAPALAATIAVSLQARRSPHPRIRAARVFSRKTLV